MKPLFVTGSFASFGPSRLEPRCQEPSLHRVQGRKTAALRQGLRLECPRQPGVYGMVDESGELLYVGKAKCLRARLLSYFRPCSRDPKAGRILRRSRQIVWEPAANEFAALLRELELIRRWRPRFNVQGQPQRRSRAYVCLGRRPAPYLFLAARPPTGLQACFGPIPAGSRARLAIRFLNDWFRLRDCPRTQVMIFADQRELFPVARTAGCLRYEIGTCLGPCAAACAQLTYAAQVRGARAFLNGSDQAPLEGLENAMAAASQSLAFERAATLRDKLDVLRWFHGQLERLRAAREQQSFIYPVEGWTGQTLWYLIHCGRVAAVTPAPHNAASRKAALDLVKTVYQKRGSRFGHLPADEIDSVLLVAAWFRRHPQEQKHALEPEQVLMDCGRTLSPRTLATFHAASGS